MLTGGFNCVVAGQVLVMLVRCHRKAALLGKVTDTFAQATPLACSQGAQDRPDPFADHSDAATRIDRGAAPDLEVTPAEGYFDKHEVFAPAMSLREIAETDPEAYLRAAGAYANDTLYGTLGNNTLIHPHTIRKIGNKRVEALLTEVRIGAPAVKAWTGLGILMTVCP